MTFCIICTDFCYSAPSKLCSAERMRHAQIWEFPFQSRGVGVESESKMEPALGLQVVRGLDWH